MTLRCAKIREVAVRFGGPRSPYGRRKHAASYWDHGINDTLRLDNELSAGAATCSSWSVTNHLGLQNPL